MPNRNFSLMLILNVETVPLDALQQQMPLAVIPIYSMDFRCKLMID